MYGHREVQLNERHELLASIANTIKDYRADDLPEPTPDHVERWIRQFGTDVQVPILREMDHILKWTYFSQSNVRAFFADVIDNGDLAGNKPRRFWRAAHLLDIQQNGNSQTEIRKLFMEELAHKYGLTPDSDGRKDGVFVYLDDVLFSGGRIGEDLSSWIAHTSPQAGIVHIIVIASHRFGEWKCKTRLEQEASHEGKQLHFHFWAALRIENRKTYRNRSEVLWPSTIPNDDDLTAYIAEETKFPFEPRTPSRSLEHAIFSSEEGRQLLERELLLAGMHIRSLSQNPSPALRPLGFGPFGLGFGSMIVTYRNCPNNVPLALWWGDSEAHPSHPFSRWYPLVQRRTYVN